MASTTASTSKKILTSSEDWEIWHKDLKNQANTHRLHEYIRRNKALLPEPTMPEMSRYPQKRSASGTSRPQTEAPSASTQTQTATAEPDDEARIVEYSDLTIEGQKSFNMAWTFYQDKLKAYDKQQEAVSKLKNWICDNVSSHYRNVCCHPDDDLPTWYESLQEHLSVSETITREAIQRKYREALKPPKNLRDLSKWVDKWEQAMQDAKRIDLSIIHVTSDWFNEMIRSLSKVLPEWTRSYRIYQDPHVEDRTLTYRTVAKDIRKVEEMEKSIGGRLAKGSFATFAENEEQDEEKPTDDDNSKKKLSQRKKKTRKQKKDEDSGDKKEPSEATDKKRSEATDKKRSEATDKKRRQTDTRVCRACEGPHPTRTCFYLFPDKAPEE